MAACTCACVCSAAVARKPTPGTDSRQRKIASKKKSQPTLLNEIDQREDRATEIHSDTVRRAGARGSDARASERERGSRQRSNSSHTAAASISFVSGARVINAIDAPKHDLTTDRANDELTGDGVLRRRASARCAAACGEAESRERARSSLLPGLLSYLPHPRPSLPPRNQPLTRRHGIGLRQVPALSAGLVDLGSGPNHREADLRVGARGVGLWIRAGRGAAGGRQLGHCAPVEWRGRYRRTLPPSPSHPS